MTSLHRSPSMLIATADPREGGRSAAVGNVVRYVNGFDSTLLIKAGSSDYAWRRPDERYILPESGAAALGLLGFTPTSMYKPGKVLNSCPDLIGTNHLTKSSTVIADQQRLEGHLVHWAAVSGAKYSADVLDPAAASFWHGVVFALPGLSTGVPAFCAIVSRFDGAANGWGAYWSSGALAVLMKDASGHSTGGLALTTPALNPETDPGTLYLFQLSFNRSTSKLNFRLSKRGATADKRQDYDASALTDTLTHASQVFGYGAANSTVAAGEAVAWGAHLAGTAKNQTEMAAIETAMGFAA